MAKYGPQKTHKNPGPGKIATTGKISNNRGNKGTNLVVRQAPSPGPEADSTHTSTPLVSSKSGFGGTRP